MSEYLNIYKYSLALPPLYKTIYFIENITQGKNSLCLFCVMEWRRVRNISLSKNERGAYNFVL